LLIETKSDCTFFRDIFRPMRDNFYDSAQKTKLDFYDVSMDLLAYEVATLFNQWAQLYTDTQYATMDFEMFKQLNSAALHFDNKAWCHESKDAEPTTTPVQRVNPPTQAVVATPPPAGGYKRGAGGTPADYLEEHHPQLRAHCCRREEPTVTQSEKRNGIRALYTSQPAESLKLSLLREAPRKLHASHVSVIADDELLTAGHPKVAT
jgi:hypothetical protein